MRRKESANARRILLSIVMQKTPLAKPAGRILLRERDGTCTNVSP
jgi:hypothetical protein